MAINNELNTSVNLLHRESESYVYGRAPHMSSVSSATRLHVIYSPPPYSPPYLFYCMNLKSAKLFPPRDIGLSLNPRTWPNKLTPGFAFSSRASSSSELRLTPQVIFSGIQPTGTPHVCFKTSLDIHAHALSKSAGKLLRCPEKLGRSSTKGPTN